MRILNMCWPITRLETSGVESKASEISYIQHELPPSSGNHQNTHQWAKWNLLLLHSSSKHVQAHFCRWWNITQKTLLITTHLRVDNFTCSNGWINTLQEGNNTVYITPTGERRHVDSETAIDRKNDWPLQETKEYDPCDIYNSDKTGLFLNLQPGKSHTFHGGPCHDGTKSKQRLHCLVHAVLMVAENYYHL
jgi:hypothetical protein